MKKQNQYLGYEDKVKVQDKVYTPVNGVILKDGLLKNVFDNNVAYLKKLDMDSMLYWFNDKLGQETKGEPYRGWFEDALKGQTASIYLMGAGNALRFVEDQELEDRMKVVLDKLDECARKTEEGYFLMPIPAEDFANGEYPNYCRIWLNYGLAAAGMAGEERAYDMLREWQDWFNHCDALPIVQYLHLAYQGIVGSTYVYTLPIGNKEDIQVARDYYEEDWRLAQFLRKERSAVADRHCQGDEPHAHGTEIEAFEGYIDLYRATGAKYYLDSILGAWELYKKDWQHPGGGIVMCEFADAYPGCGWISDKHPYNELCCSAFWANLNQRLHRLFPDREEFVDEIEKSIYNIAVSNQIGGDSIRYHSYLEGKKEKGGLVHCCCGSGTRLYGSLPEYLYSISEDSIYVDIYAASEIEWNRKAGNVTIETKTNMPYEQDVTVCVKAEKPETFTMALRMPSWMPKACTVVINGSEEYCGVPGSYLKINRTWKDGDEVTFRLPMEFRYKLYEGADQLTALNHIKAGDFLRYSFEYGPLLYAVEGAIDYKTSIWVKQEPEKVNDWAIPTKENLVFEVEGNSSQKLVPYFSVAPEQTFTCFPVFAKPHFR